MRADDDDDPGPIACTLSAADLVDRGEAWRRVLTFATARDDVDGGVLITFDDAPGVAATLEQLAALEAECCSWMAMTVSSPPPRLRIASTGDGVGAVRRMFAV